MQNNRKKVLAKHGKKNKSRVTKPLKVLKHQKKKLETGNSVEKGKRRGMLPRPTVTRTFQHKDKTKEP